MPDDPKQGLFFPARQAAAAPGAVTSPSIEAAAAAETQARPRGLQLPRRMALRWAGWGSVLLVVGGWLNGFLGFFYPHKTGAFGGTITAGTAEELKVGDVKVVPDGKFYVSRVPEGFLALWWKCPHLGCTVPWKPDDPSEDSVEPKGRFNCPCHGSIYDRYGKIIQGPAPRPMDIFPVEIRDGKIYVNTNPTQA